MRILGIDPGTIAMGYGVIESRDDETTLIDCGVLTPTARSPIGERARVVRAPQSIMVTLSSLLSITP